MVKPNQLGSVFTNIMHGREVLNSDNNITAVEANLNTWVEMP